MNKLKFLLKKAKLTQNDLRNLLKIKALSTINLKLNEKSDFTTKEARLIKDEINRRLNTNYSIEDLFN